MTPHARNVIDREPATTDRAQVRNGHALILQARFFYASVFCFSVSALGVMWWISL